MQIEHKYELKIVTDRTDALYHVNEPVKFKITLSNNRKPVSRGEINYFLSNDGLGLSHGKQTIIDGRVILSGQMSKPGFLRCKVSYDLIDGKTLSARAAAGIDPLKIKPSMPAPDDFDEFWDKQKRKLAKVPMNPVLTPVDSHRQGIEANNLKLDCLESIPPVSAYFARTSEAKPKSMPAIMRVHGGGIYPRAEAKPSYHYIDEGSPPKVNAAKPPGQWQTLDIIFQSPRFDKDGKKTAHAKFVKVVHNGQVVQENQEVPYASGTNWNRKQYPQGPIIIQGDYGPIAVRNIRINAWRN